MPTINLGYKKRSEYEVSAKKRWYQSIYQSPRWKALRREKFSNNPICERCLELGIVRPTEHIHHKVPFKYGMTQDQVEALAYDYDNLLALCIDCHSLVEMQLKRERYERKID